MAEKNVILKDGEDILYPKTLLSLVDGMPQPTSADNGKMLGVEDGAYKLVEGGGGGGSLYRHHIRILTAALTMNNAVLVSFISNSNTPISSISELATYLYNNGFVGWASPMKATSYRTDGYNDSFCAIYSSNGQTVTRITLNGTESNYQSYNTVADDITTMS